MNQTMNALRLNDPAMKERQLIDEAIATNGASRVLFAALLAVLRGRPGKKARPPDALYLSAHMRRDIGLAREFEMQDYPQFYR